MTIRNEFAQLQRTFERLNRSSQGRSRNGTFGGSLGGTFGSSSSNNSASILGDLLIQQLLGGGASGPLNGGFNGGISGGRSSGGAFNGGINPSAGGNTATGLGGLFSQNTLQLGLASVFSNLFEGLAGDVFNRTRTTTSARESERSQELATRWNTSRSQQDALLANIVNRGLGQL